MNKKLRLTEISKMEMNHVRVGAAETCICICGCVGSSTNQSNGGANRDSGKYSPGGGTYYPQDSQR